MHMVVDFIDVVYLTFDPALHNNSRDIQKVLAMTGELMNLLALKKKELKTENIFSYI